MMFYLRNPQQGTLHLQLKDSHAGREGFHALQVPTLAKNCDVNQCLFED